MNTVSQANVATPAPAATQTNAPAPAPVGASQTPAAKPAKSGKPRFWRKPAAAPAPATNPITKP